jgi:hypothetical protein
MKRPSSLPELAFLVTICVIGIAAGALGAAAIALVNLDIITRLSGYGPDDDEV